MSKRRKHAGKAGAVNRIVVKGTSVNNADVSESFDLTGDSREVFCICINTPQGSKLDSACIQQREGSDPKMCSDSALYKALQGYPSVKFICINPLRMHGAMDNAGTFIIVKSNGPGQFLAQVESIGLMEQIPRVQIEHMGETVLPFSSDRKHAACGADTTTKVTLDAGRPHPITITFE